MLRKLQIFIFEYKKVKVTSNFVKITCNEKCSKGIV